MLKALVKKDLLFEPVFRFLVPFWNVSFCVILLWAALEPNPTWPLPRVRWGLSSASQIFIPATMFSPFFFSYFYMEVIRLEKQYGSFIYLRTFPISPAYLFWGRIISCWLLSLLCILPVYITFIITHVVGLVADDLITPLILGIRFPLFLAANAFLASTLMVGSAMVIAPRSLPVVAAIIGTAVVLTPFLISELTVGIKFELLLFKVARMFGTMLRSSAAFFALALLLGGGFSWAFCRKRSYV
jgi:hypothetical protein